jgi:glycosyltransferase involved in cell wall biosynthesis
MIILAIVPCCYDKSPGQRFRMEQWEPLLRRAGIVIEFAPFECEELHASLYESGGVCRKLRLISRAWSRRARLLRSIREYDAVYIFREAAVLGPALFERRVWHAGVSLIFDFDDAIFVPYTSPSNGYLSLLKFPWKTGTICRLASHVMAGNTYLANYARQFNEQVTVVPTTIDTEKYSLQLPHATALPVIGWSGSHSTLKYMDILREPLRDLARRTQFRLRVIGARNYEIEGVDVEVLPWCSETEVADLRPIDIGLMPLPEDRWAKGKCGLKALQYMALGIPSVCSPVGVNCEIIQDGENGFLASAAEEWVDKLELLIRSVEIRQKLGSAGRATVEAGYSARVQAPRVQRIFEDVLDRRSNCGTFVHHRIGARSC